MQLRKISKQQLVRMHLDKPTAGYEFRQTSRPGGDSIKMGETLPERLK